MENEYIGIGDLLSLIEQVRMAREAKGALIGTTWNSDTELAFAYHNVLGQEGARKVYEAYAEHLATLV